MDRLRTELLFYDLLEESDDINDLNDNIDFLIDCMRMSVLDLCSDNEWDCYSLDNDLM